MIAVWTPAIILLDLLGIINVPNTGGYYGRIEENGRATMSPMEIDSEGSRRFEAFLNEIANIKYCRVRDTHQDGLRAQISGIDYVSWDCRGHEVPLELKTEAQNRYNNFFIELFASVSPFKSGWIQTCSSQVLVYQFLDTKELYWMDVAELRTWLFGTGAFTRYPLKPQRKHATAHTAYGLCVPIADVMRNIEVQKFSL